jgi:hypothetical protein
MLVTALTASIEAIALSSDEGISLSELFAQVSSQHGMLTSVARTLLWRQLVTHPDINIVENDMDEEEVRSISVETALHVGIRISASRDLQDAALGVYAARLQRFALSDTQRSTLRLLASSKERGMLQSQLTSILGVDPRNYSYVVKNLEERGLVVKCQALIKAAPESTPHDKKPPPPAATNLVVLSRFASRGVFADLSVGLSTARVMTEEHGQGNGYGGEDGNADADDNGDGDNEVEDGPDGHVISTDDVHIRGIISKLSSLENFTAKESHLKQVLGFVRKQGHRLWRRLRGLLVKRGTIETFVGVDKETGKTSVFVKLLKPLIEGQNSVEEEEEEEDTVTKALGHLLDEKTGKLNIYGKQVAELSLDRQLLRLLAEAGSAGLTTAAIDTALRLNMKRNEPRIREMKAACGPGGVTEIHVTAGRSRMLRFTAAPHVLDAIFRAGPNELVADGKGSEAASKKVEQNVKAEGGPLTTIAIETPQIPVHGGQEPEQQIPPEKHKDRHNKKSAAKTELGVMRRNWLVQYVLSEGIVLTYEVGRYLQQAERDAKGCHHHQGGADAVRPDRKVIQRIISAAVEDGELCIIPVTLPGVHGLKGSRAQGVLAKPGTVQDAAFMDAVYQRHKEAQKLQRVGVDNKLKSVTSAVTMEGGASEDLQIVAVQSLRQEAAEAVARRKQLYQDRFADEAPEDFVFSLPAVQIDARFLPARMLRVEGIFETAWELVTTRESKSPIAPFLDSAAAKGNAYILRGGPFQGAGEQHARVFTGQELWKFLTVDKFFECLGTRASPSDIHAALISYSVASGSPMRLGSMAPKDLLQIAGGQYGIDRAKIALTRTMDLLHRMGLLSPITILGQSSSSVDDEDAVYLLSNTMWYDTVPNEPEQTRTFVAAEDDARLQYDAPGSHFTRQPIPFTMLSFQQSS